MEHDKCVCVCARARGCVCVCVFVCASVSNGKPERGGNGKPEGGIVENQNRDRGPNNGTPEGVARLINAMLCVSSRIAAILARALGPLVLGAGALRDPCLCSIFAILFGFGHGAYKVVTEEAWHCRA